MRISIAMLLLAAAIGVAVVHSPMARADGDTAGPQDGVHLLATAVFAGGCFWCMEPPFDRISGVRSTTSGYTGGHTPNPTYKAVSTGGTGHVEAVQVVYDPSQVSYDQLLDVFWHNVDPLTSGGQFCDRGSSYVAAIFYASDEQRMAADASKHRVQKRFRQTVVTDIRPAATFYPAEEYHQDYYQKNPIRYRYYRTRCGRDARLATLWGKSTH